ncbi:hypothetical protein EYE42_05745 [Paracoccus subflavus]|uniref:Lipoprotein n=1 Tax=Paracoccus subflavus TaxID=2528244 RepID=A0A4Q9G5K0_9RHOB|nr:hypothetical protein [Paracoccus subflavus]TBN41904.1 hypothetical protein EYE42_05745 [Paracoccus subflavus]
MRGARAGSLVLMGLLAALSACGPVPVEQAELTCLRDARLAERPQTNVSLGVGTGIGGGGTRGFGSVSVDLSGDYLMGRDPSQVYDRCVQRRSGQMPRRPLYDQPGWTG